MEKWRVQYKRLSDGSEVYNVVIGNHGIYSCITEGEAFTLCDALNAAVENPSGRRKKDLSSSLDYDGPSRRQNKEDRRMRTIVASGWPFSIAPQNAGAELKAINADLLQALEAILPLARIKYGNLVPAVNDAFAKADAAIAKAKP